MSTLFAAPPPTTAAPRRRRSSRASLAAHGEPVIWLMGGALGVCLCMILGLLAFIIVQGMATFWPSPLTQLKTLDGTSYLGEVIQSESYRPGEELWETLPPEVAATAKAAVEAQGGFASRRHLRTGNFELSGSHFTWVEDFRVQEESQPPWALLIERDEWGRFYGIPEAFLVDGIPVAEGQEGAWQKFQATHPEVRARRAERMDLEENEIGQLSAELRNEQLRVRQTELDFGRDSTELEQASAAYDRLEADSAKTSGALREKIDLLNQENARYRLKLLTADGEETELAVEDIVRAFPANQLDFGDRLGVYFSRWGEFLSADPRNSNSEGGVFPAIFGTVVMTLIMTVAVLPFGVLAALYLREYAKRGAIVSAVRIAINNLAGVPSIVFGVFGLGFFCYIVGGQWIDPTFYEARLPDPTFGKGTLLWASLTLALLTLPVVIVATEEALAAVPGSMREGSYACGASKWQTIWRIVLPRAMPGIMTGMILAMSRGAGEVAPLMLVGAARIAEDLPVDGSFPFLHPERKFMHLGYHIYDLGFQSPNSEAAKPMVFTTTLLLIAIITTLNLAAIWIRGRLRRRFSTSQF